MNLRTLLFWSHLAAGCVVGTVVLVMSVTGLMLAFRPQLIAFFDRGYNTAPPPANVAPPDIEQMLAAVAEVSPATPTSLTLRSDPSTPASITLGRDHVLLVNRYTNQVLGKSVAQAFFQSVEVWHRWLGGREENARAVGHAVKGACNLAFLFMLVSGLYLWIPRMWTKKHIGAVALFRSGLTGRARDFNWHNVIGLWCAVPLLVISFTGVVMSYQWANDLVYRITGNPPPTRNAEPGRRNQNQHTEPGWTGLNAQWTNAEQQVPGWRILTLRLPASKRAPLNFTIDIGDGGRPDQRSQLTLDRRTGEVLRLEKFSDFNAGRQLRTWIRFTHTGEAGGILGRTLAAVAACGAITLVWTGLFLAGRRFLSWQKRKRKSLVTRIASSPLSIGKLIASRA